MLGQAQDLLFQSSAGFDPGRYSSVTSRRFQLSLFQSSAGFDPGRYRVLRPVQLPDLVSILGRV